jgi:hypothetical protein
MTTTTTTTLAWAGWLRQPGSRWRKVCGADDYATCWGCLLAIKAGQHSERVVLRAGKTPADRPQPRGRTST